MKEFTLADLGHSAKNNAHANWLEGREYGWSDENRATLEDFESKYPVRVKDWQYGDRSYINATTVEPDDWEESLTGVRLATWLYNQFKWELYDEKTYYCSKYKKKRKSNIFVEPSCPTGYCMDYTIRKPIYDFIANPRKYYTLEDVMEACLQEWLSDCSKDYEYCFSFEAFEQYCIDGEIKFDEDGEQL